ncbi:hypothetical protein E2C01_096458 [Portunus trituberculatus]|uniref:Uncharacterized protein n=1 Tax=Portunus trituberculatus TaxID=210409 RepID=A0A5B7JSM3_PORTR|nr:hypothetical protein [Portunus trituberculatus]
MSGRNVSLHFPRTSRVWQRVKFIHLFRLLCILKSCGSSQHSPSQDGHTSTHWHTSSYSTMQYNS